MRLSKDFSVTLVVLLLVSLFVFNPDAVIQKALNGYTDAEVEQIYDDLFIQSGLQGKPPLTVLYSSTVNAWTDGSSVVITTGLLKIMKTKHEIAMVLGHELGHVVNFDVQHGEMENELNANIDSRYKEASSDKVGAFMMMRAGYNICKGKNIMNTFREKFGSAAASDTHPDHAFRVDELNLPMCQGILGFLRRTL